MTGDQDDETGDVGSNGEIPWDAGNLSGEVSNPAEFDSATADLDDDLPPGTTGIVPNAPPLTLQVVESLLDRRRNEVQISPTLDRITALLDLLGNPQTSYPVIQIAGTNGKTSTARMIDALLERSGLRVGRFTSPHLQLVTERIAIDGAPDLARIAMSRPTPTSPPTSSWSMRHRTGTAGCRCRSSRSSPRWPMPRSRRSRWMSR